MREFIGLTHPLRIKSSLKKEALIFSRIAIYDFEHSSNLLEAHADENTLSSIREMQWLLDQGIAFDPGVSYTPVAEDDEYRSLIAEAELYRIRELESINALVEGSEAKVAEAENLLGLQAPPFQEIDRLLKEANSSWGEIINIACTASDTLSRIRGVQLRLLEGAEAVPLFYNKTLPIRQQTASKVDIIRISLAALPIPDESTSWEQIVEYRSDPDSRSKFLALRHWMSEVARAELTPADVEEKLEYLIDQYQKHMRLHRIKTNTGTLETIVTTVAEFLGDLVSFKWGKAAEALFSLRRRRVALLEGELTAPGNEVAYIVKARETFS
jgi:hypothetical protein